MIHIILLFMFFVFVHITLFIPGYTLVVASKLLSKKMYLEICAGYALTLILFALLSIASYALKIPHLVIQVLLILLLISTAFVFIYKRLYVKLESFYLIFAALLLMSLLSLLFIHLTLKPPYPYIPDPQPIAGYAYNVFDVKVLNIAQTNANDNYIPYRQAQFIINRSNPAKDSFIDEWGVSFFQRTPLMGAVTASYYLLLHENLPIGYIWSPDSRDVHQTYQQFQVIASILNALFIIPAFFLIYRFFTRKAALASLAFFITSQFYLYNSFFTWPKSLVAFFVLLSWLLILEKELRYLILAAIVTGAAYLTHDLAILYIAASCVLLLYLKRFRDIVIFLAILVFFAIPWLITSAIVYHKPSTFIYYPFDTSGIPQYADRAKIIKRFLHTSPFRLITIRIESLLYLLSPYQLLITEGSQNITRRLWAVGIFSIPGAVGLGLIPYSVIGLFKQLKNMPMWILIFVPVAACAVVIGWPRGLGALHFAEASVALLIGLGVWLLTTLRSRLWLVAAYIACILQLVHFGLYSFNYSYFVWLHDTKDVLILLLLASILILCGTYLYNLDSKFIHRGKKEPDLLAI